MPGKARRKSQRANSMLVRTDADVVAEVERLAAAARVPRDTLVTHALRHFIRFHALTSHNRVRWVRDPRVTNLFPADPPVTPINPDKPQTDRRRRRG